MTDAAVTLLVGARAYPIDHDAATWLIEVIRTHFKDVVDVEQWNEGCISVAEKVEQAINNPSAQPIDLSNDETDCLRVYVLRDYLVQGHEGLTALFIAIRRISGELP